MGLLCIAYLLLQTVCLAQFPLSEVNIWIKGKKESPNRLHAEIISAQDSLEALQILQNWFDLQQMRGFRETGLDSIQRIANSWHVFIHVGAYYQWETFSIEDLGVGWQRKAGLDFPITKGHPFYQPELEHALSEALVLFQDEGYPFAQIEQKTLAYEAIGQDSIGVNLSYAFDPGQLIKVDSIKIKGNPREQAAFLHVMIRLKPGDLYNQSLINDIPRLLNDSI